jgi:hypothetical protein
VPFVRFSNGKNKIIETKKLVSDASKAPKKNQQNQTTNYNKSKQT